MLRSELAHSPARLGARGWGGWLAGLWERGRKNVHTPILRMNCNIRQRGSLMAVCCLSVGVAVTVIRSILTDTLMFDASSSIKDGGHDTKNTPAASPHRQRVVLLAGPHKTASSSIQANLMAWLDDDQDPSGLLAKRWVWPSPMHRFRDDGCKPKTKEYFVFYWWIHAMLGRTDADCMRSPDGSQAYSRDQMIQIYRHEFQDRWENGSSLAIASEGMDFVGSIGGRKNAGLLDQIIDQLPTKDLSDMTAVVVYRSPRSEHLQSMWHQYSAKTKENLTFGEYLETRTDAPNALKTLDSLHLAQTFLDRGLKVVLVDMAGVLGRGYDMSQVIACDVLGADCDVNKHFLGGSNSSPIVANVRHKPHSITAEQMNQIDDVIEEYDCNYVSLVDHTNLTILHSYALERVFEKCKSSADGRLMNRTELTIRIKDIASTSLSPEQQRTVLLAGPHKTASTSIQDNLYSWLVDEKDSSGLIADRWVWPTPIKEFLERGCNVTDDDVTRKYSLIYWWMQRMKKKKTQPCTHFLNGTRRHSMDEDEYLDFFRREFQRQWEFGNNLVIASEGMDIIGNGLSTGRKFMDRVLGLLPGNIDDLTAVVVYRSPRSEHLQSMWHQCCMEKESFEHYLTMSSQRSWFPIWTLDSLHLAQTFLDRGLKVVLVDMAGVLGRGYDMSQVIACDVLGADCDVNKHFLGGSNSSPIVANVRRKPHSITAEQMNQIDDVIEEYDCNYVSLVDHTNLTILHSYALERVFEKCKSSADGRLMNRTELTIRIKDIASTVSRIRSSPDPALRNTIST